MNSTSVPAPVWPWLLVCAATAFFIDLGTYHRHHHGDSLIPVMIGLHEWTPYSWEQNRLGSLIPLLALPFRHPLDHLLVQHFASFFLSLLAFFLLPRYVLRDRSWPLVGVVGATLFLAFAPEMYRFENLNAQMPWWNALALGVAGLLLTESPRSRWRVVPGTLFLLLAHWLNTGMAVPLGLLIGTKTAFELGDDPSDKRNRIRRLIAKIDRTQFAILSATFVAGILGSMLLSPVRDTSMVPMWPHLWLESWGKLAVVTWGDLTKDATVLWPVVLPVAAGIGSVWLLRFDRAARNHFFRASAILGITGVVTALIIASLDWVRLNEWSGRYWLIPVMLVQASLSVLVAGPLMIGTSAKVRRLSLGLGALLVPGMALWMYGPPSLEVVRADLERTIGKHTKEIVETECTHVLGNFWDVWPATYHANLTLADRGESRTVWGIAHRCGPARRHWGHLPIESFRFATVRESRWTRDDSDWVTGSFEFYLNPPPGTLEALEERSTIRVLHWKPTRRDD